MLVLLHGHGQAERLGSTFDDAAGEAFEKIGPAARFGLPRGPAIQQQASLHPQEMSDCHEPGCTARMTFRLVGSKPRSVTPAPGSGCIDTVLIHRH
jgi:tRNA A37 threonylcarbamoyltransferase TsaD